MGSAECSMGLRSFLVHDEPLNAGRLKMTDGRLCEELEIKSLMASPLTNSQTHLSNGNAQKANHTSTAIDYAAARTESSSTTSSSSVCSTNNVRPQPRRRSITLNNGAPQSNQKPSRTPSTASTSLSSNGTVRNTLGTTNSSTSTFRQPQRPSSQQYKGNQVEYTEPTVLIAHRAHPHPSFGSETTHLQHLPAIPTASDATPTTGILLNSSTTTTNPTLRRRDSNNSADLEVSATLRHRSRTQTSDEMADEDELLDEAAGDQLGNNIVDGFDHMHGPRRRISPHSDVIRSLKLPAPNKEQVLNYVANTKSVHIRRAGTELQITDSTGFPLMDAWTKNSFCQHTWILESYGRNVLLLHDTGPTWRKLWSNKKRSMILEVEENEEILGYFVVAEPFVIQNRDHQPVARFNAYDSGDGRSILYQCVLDCSGEEIARLEPRKAQLSQLRFGAVATFPLKLLILAAAIRISALSQATNAVIASTRRPTSTKRRNKSSCCSIV